MIDTLLQVAALLTTAFLFGGMLLFAGGFASFLFTAMPVPEARQLIRKAFPPFYLYVILTAALAAALAWPQEACSAWILAFIALTTLPTRQLLMPAINRATDEGRTQRFAWLHGFSVLITLGHIGLAGWALVRLAS